MSTKRQTNVGVAGSRVNKENCVQCGTSQPKCTYCLGCGQQAWYQSCADIAIIDTMGSHPAVQGVRTQQELKQKWEQTLKDLKGNCSCDGPVVSKPSDNSINASYPSSESTTSGLSPSGQGTVTRAPQGSGSGSGSGSSSSCSSSGSCTHNQQTKPNTYPKPARPDTIHPNTKPTRPDDSLNPTNSGISFPKPSNPGHGLGSDRPVFNRNWRGHVNTGTQIKRPPTNRNPFRRKRPPLPQHATGTGRCYVPFRPPWYMRQNARAWCVRNCPQSGSPCGYRVCRPVNCRRRTPHRVVRNKLDWLLPLLLMEGFEL